MTYGDVWFEDIQDVFQGFDLSEVERDFIYYPHFGIRFELDISYRIDTGEPGTGIICK